MNPENQLIQWIKLIVSAAWLVLLLCGATVVVLNFPGLLTTQPTSIAEVEKIPVKKSG